MKKIEDNNTLVFIVETRANKSQIKAAVRKLYEIQVRGCRHALRSPRAQRRARRQGRAFCSWPDCARNRRPPFGAGVQACARARGGILASRRCPAAPLSGQPNPGRYKHRAARQTRALGRGRACLASARHSGATLWWLSAAHSFPPPTPPSSLPPPYPQADKINTLIRPDGSKKAYVRLTSDYDALDVANKIGII